MNIKLKAVKDDDLATLFDFQNDPIANQMADFPARSNEDFITHWKQNIFANSASITQSIWFNDQLVGHLVSWIDQNKSIQDDGAGIRLIGYWIGREFWGQGIATQALKLFLKQYISSPVYAYIDKHNMGSLKVVEYNGFVDISAEYPQLISKANLLLFRLMSV